MVTSRFGVKAILFVLLVALVPASAAYGATFTVNTSTDLTDVSPGDGSCDADRETTGDQCSLRAAIQEANSLSGDDTIRFDSSLDGIPLTLTLANVDPCSPSGCFEENDATTGDLDITGNLTIIGNGPDKTIIQGGATLDSSVDRVLDVGPAGEMVTVNISGVTIRFGRPADGRGGGISSLGFGTVLATITDSVISDNQAFTGGGIEIGNGDLFLDRVTVARNTAQHGGGLNSFGSSLISITNSTFSDNTADDGSGGGQGGGLFIGSFQFTPTIFNSTLTGNRAAEGCATYNPDGTLRLYNVTVANNCTPGSGQAAIVAARFEGEGNTVFRNSVLTSPEGVVNCRTASGFLTSEGYNVSSDASCMFSVDGDLENTNPLLGPLADNGGLTQTHLPLPGSPAIDTGTPEFCPPTDQRGFERPADGNGNSTAECDKGSVEVAAGGPGPSTGSIQGTKWNDANGDGVRLPAEAGVAGVQICLFPTSPSTCTVTAANGTYQFSSIAPGTYQVYERLPAGRINTTTRFRQVDVSAGQTVTGVDFGNIVPPAIPSSIVDVNTAWQTAGIPVLPRGRPLIVRVTPPCDAASATATLVDGAGLRTQAMTNVGGNTWETTFTPPFSGRDGRLTVNVTCVDGSTREFTGLIRFVDPSGTILDSCTGKPLAGASVTLFKNEPFDSATYVVPDPGEHIPTNNPEITEADGLYAWDVVPGRWRVEASKAGYTTVPTSPFDVPPQVVGLDITLTPTAGCPINRPPVARDDAYKTRKKKTFVVPAPGVLANDTDPDSPALTAMRVRGPAHGVLTLNPDGSFVYKPKRGFVGKDTFTYKASDGVKTSNTATVTINVARKREKDKDDDEDDDRDDDDDNDRDDRERKDERRGRGR